MKISELMEQPKDLAQTNDLDAKGKEMKLPNQYEVKDIGGKDKISAQTTVVKDTKTGKVYGRRTIHQKEA